MSILRCKLITTLIMAYSVMICTNTMAYDVSVSDFEWYYPEMLSPDTSEIQYHYRLQLSPSSYVTDCYYRTQLYLSTDRIFSDDDFELFDPIDTLLPAGAIGFSSTVTRWFYMNTSLPSTGTYYIFLKVTPTQAAPSDTDSSNNTTMALNPIQVVNATVPPPPLPAETMLTTAMVITTPQTGQSMIITSYSNGVLEFRDWQANVLATRDNFKEITTLATGIVGSPPRPRLFVASTNSGGTVHVIDPVNIDQDLISHTNLGRISAIVVRGGSDGAAYIGTSDMGGTLRKLDALTLANEGVRGTLGGISDIIRMRSSWGEILAIGTDKAGGSVYFMDLETLDEVATQQQNLGLIYGLCSADMDRDGHTELLIASDTDGGSIQLREGPSFEIPLAIRTGLGKINTLDYGSLDSESYLEPVDNTWILFASESKGGSLNMMSTDLGTSIVKFQNAAVRRDLGPIRYAELRDFYMVGTPVVGAIWEGDTGPALHIMDESLTDPDIEPVTIEDFETGDFRIFPWEHSGNAEWTVTSQEKNSGLFSAASGSIDHNNSTTLEIRLQCVSGNITFYHKVSCEPYFDHLEFYIDGILQGTWSGEVDWTETSFDVMAGARTFTWTYSKDTSVSRGDDTVWIDDIEFPIIAGSVITASSVRKAEQSPYRIDIEYTFDN